MMAVYILTTGRLQPSKVRWLDKAGLIRSKAKQNVSRYWYRPRGQVQSCSKSAEAIKAVVWCSDRKCSSNMEDRWAVHAMDKSHCLSGINQLFRCKNVVIWKNIIVLIKSVLVTGW